MSTEMQTLTFEARASLPKQAIVMIFDLEGFSRFFSQPDVHYYVPKFLNRVFEAVGISMFGGKEYWLSNEEVDGFDSPVHTQFLGDGALYVWEFDEDFHDYVQSHDFVYFLNRIWNLKKNFYKIVEICAQDIPLAELPRRIRFGFAAGSVYKLPRADNPDSKEYIGYCINLASRLQSYCKDLGFIASARIGLPQSVLDENGYIKVVAKNIKGFPREVVIVDVDEFGELAADVRNDLFETL